MVFILTKTSEEMQDRIGGLTMFEFSIPQAQWVQNQQAQQPIGNHFWDTGPVRLQPMPETGV
jgi:hypothetical protein